MCSCQTQSRMIIWALCTHLESQPEAAKFAPHGRDAALLASEPRAQHQRPALCYLGGPHAHQTRYAHVRLALHRRSAWPHTQERRYAAGLSLRFRCGRASVRLRVCAPALTREFMCTSQHLAFVHSNFLTKHVRSEKHRPEYATNVAGFGFWSTSQHRPKGVNLVKSVLQLLLMIRTACSRMAEWSRQLRAAAQQMRCRMHTPLLC